MSLQLLGANPTMEGISVTFATDEGVETLEGSCEEVARLAEVMRQVSVLAQLNDGETCWVAEVPMGEAVVKLGLRPGGQARVRIIRP